MARILIVDDDETMCHALSRTVQRLGHKSVSAGTASEALKIACEADFDAIFLDVRLPDGSGLDLLPQLQACPSAPEVIIITGLGDPDGAELAITKGAWDYIEKTDSLKKISLTLERALQYRNERIKAGTGGAVRALRREHIIGESSAIQRCLDTVAECATSDASVLITGETGTGKELFARAIHENSKRADEEFVVVDCAALPETLIESLLFGHKKGAFTGADRDRIGLVLQANKGTLFLDEIGEMPMSLQKSFLRVLQERSFRPLGAKGEEESDFRLVCATNRDLHKMVKDETFRSDLLFRIQSFRIDLPPLRERLSDIKDIATYYIDTYCKRHELSRKACFPDVFDILEAYDWPGNVRELAHTLDRALSAAHSEPFLFPKHLPPEIRVSVTRARVAGPGADQTEEEAEAFSPGYDVQHMPPLQEFRDQVIEQAEQAYLTDLMVSVGYSVKKALAVSGLSQSRLYALLKKYGISKSPT